jgi:hypothetical protein
VSIVGPTEARPADGLAVDFVVESDRAQLSTTTKLVQAWISRDSQENINYTERLSCSSISEYDNQASPSLDQPRLTRKYQLHRTPQLFRGLSGSPCGGSPVARGIFHLPLPRSEPCRTVMVLVVLIGAFAHLDCMPSDIRSPRCGPRNSQRRPALCGFRKEVSAGLRCAFVKIPDHRHCRPLRTLARGHAVAAQRQELVLFQLVELHPLLPREPFNRIADWRGSS